MVFATILAWEKANDVASPRANRTDSIAPIENKCDISRILIPDSFWSLSTASTSPLE